MNKTDFTTIDLLRHGEVQGGARYRGSSNDALTDFGWQQMLNATHNQSWDAVVSSPLQRCANFAEHLSTDAQTYAGLEEINFGEWEGKTADEIIKNSPEAFTNFINNADKYPPPKGERLSFFIKRVTSEWRNIIAQHKHQHILLISHGGTMRTLISHALNMPHNNIMKDMMRLDVPLASMSRIRIYHDDNNYHDNKVDCLDCFPSLVFHGRVAGEQITN